MPSIHSFDVPMYLNLTGKGLPNEIGNVNHSISCVFEYLFLRGESGIERGSIEW